jgi:nitroreductase
MTRAFGPEPVDPAALDRVLDAGRRAPAAGNTVEARAFVVLAGDETSAYWSVALPDPSGFGFPGLLAAPVLVVVCVRPGAYAERYAEPDKGRAATLGRGPAAWPQPFWWFDAGTAAQAMLAAAEDEGLGACLFGLFEREVPVLRALGVPAGWRGAGVLALGRPAPGGQRPGRSAGRTRAPLDQVVHRGGW